MVPGWLHGLSIAALALGFACAVLIALDVLRHPQHMAIMNIVWPVTALFGTVLTLWGYFRWGRLATQEEMKAARARGEQPPSKIRTPLAAMVGKGTSHCGSACALADIAGEWLTVLAPGLLAWFGLGSVFEEKIYSRWVLDYLLAFVLGIVFQYFTIVPMRQLSFLPGVWAAVKADTLSLTAWQLGMYGFMAVAHFWLFARVLGTPLEVASPEFWFMMQIAMLCGFATSYPVNWWLVSKGWKEKM